MGTDGKADATILTPGIAQTATTFRPEGTSQVELFGLKRADLNGSQGKIMSFHR